MAVQYNRTLGFWSLLQQPDTQFGMSEWPQISDILDQEGLETDWASWTAFLGSLKSSAQATL
jgi:hypothetical protein